MWGSFIKPFIMRRRIKSNIVYSTILKPGERAIDKRYKDGVDTGRFSSNRIPLPLITRNKKNSVDNNQTQLT